MRSTLGDATATVARALDLSTTDARVTAFINEAQQRLLAKGKWVGTTQRYRICVNDGNITWPRQIEAIELAAISNNPVPVRSEWYEFSESGMGIITEDCSCSTSTGCCGSSGASDLLVDRGTSCTFDDIEGNTKIVRVVSDKAEAVGAEILIQGYDGNGNWIQTLDGGDWINGVNVPISTTAQDTTITVASITAVQKPSTNGAVRLYEVDPATGATKALAVYESDETRPEYRRSLVRGLCACSDSSDYSSVEVLAKLRFIPAVSSTDWLLIGNIPALKLECMAIQKEERNLFDEAFVCESKAIEILQDELKTYQGDGVQNTLRVATGNTFFASGMVGVQ